MTRKVQVSLLAILLAVATGLSSLGWVIPGDPTNTPYTDVSGLAWSWIIPQTKLQTNNTILYYSNNPELLINEPLDDVPTAPVSISSQPSCLAYSNLIVGKTYRIFVSHLNRTSAPAQNVGVALMIRTTGSGTFRLNKKAVGSGTDFAGTGLAVGRNFMNSSYSSTFAIPTAWSYFDGPYTISPWQCIVMMYDITVTSGSGTISLGVSAAPSAVNIQSAWRAGQVWDPPKEGPRNPLFPEDRPEAGTFNADKTVELVVDLDSMTVGSARKDRIGHFFSEYLNEPQRDGGLDEYNRTRDGWASRYPLPPNPSAPGSYLPGNFGVVYHYTVRFTGSSAKQGAILIGPGDASEMGLVLKRSGESARILGPVTDPDFDSHAWLIGKGTGGTTLTFDTLVPSGVNLPYQVWCERFQ